MALALKINGEFHEIATDPETPLAYVLRNELKLKGTKLGCGLEQCGACAVLANGACALSCAKPAKLFEGIEILTIEGLAATEIGARVQAAFKKVSAVQCGYCTPGLVVATTALLLKGGPVDRESAGMALKDQICRCGSHDRVLKAVLIAAEQN